MKKTKSAPKSSAEVPSDSDSTEQLIKRFAAVSTLIFSEFTKKGQSLTPEIVAHRFTEHPDIRSLLDNMPEIHARMDASVSTLDTEDLKKQVENLQNQKGQLLRQLAELEERRTFQEGYFKKTVLFFISLLDIKDRPELVPTIGKLKDAMRSESDLKTVDLAFSELKNVILRTDLKMKTPKEDRTKPYTFFSKFLKSDLSQIDEKTFEDNFFRDLKKSYHEIMDELKLNLSQVYLKKILRIERQIDESDTVEELHMIRGDILTLIHNYITSIGSEREKTASFIREIGQKLIDVEKLIFDSLVLSTKNAKSNTEFTASLKDNIKELKHVVDSSQTLEDLKNAVAGTLSTIKAAVEKKHKHDQLWLDKIRKKVIVLKTNLANLKEEANEAKEHARLLEREATIDPLTNVYNRRAYEHRIAEEMERYLRYRHPFSLLMLDVDHFKRINDQYGYAIGDKCLKEIIRLIQPKLRDTDFISRYGGEEFVVILPETDKDLAVTAGEKLRRAVEKIEFIHKEEVVHITVSVGISQTVHADKNHQMLFERVNEALRQAKRSGRNKVVCL